MPAYIPYPKVKDTPSRNVRKGSRLKVFLTNKKMALIARKAARLERKEAREAAAQEEVEATEE